MSTKVILQSLVEINAGKCSWDGNVVVPLPEKGRIVLGVASDRLLRVQWVTRPRLEIKESLIVISDAYLDKIEQAKNGRVYVLRFTSSDKKLIFWLQDFDSSNDEAKIKEFNDYIKSFGLHSQDRSNTTTFTTNENSQQQSPDSTAPATQISTDTTVVPTSSVNFSYRRDARQPHPHLPTAVPLASILDRNQLLNLTSDEAIAEELMSHLPAEMHSREYLLSVVQSPQLQSSLGLLTRAVYSDQLPLLLTSMGATQSSENFGPYPDMMDVFITSLEETFGKSEQPTSNEEATLGLPEDGGNRDQQSDEQVKNEVAEPEKDGEDDQPME